MTRTSQQLIRNLDALRAHMDAAARRAGRSGDSIQLIAVTKYVDAELAAALAEAGCHDLAESRPQELWRKTDAVPLPNIRWHLIGHLQRNKVKRTLPLLHLFHAGDSLELLGEIERQASALGRRVPTLLEVNVSGDPEKHGFAPAAVPAVLLSATEFAHIQICGLMAMASREGDLAKARADFRRLRALRDDLLPQTPCHISLDELSMGMSGDFEVAIEEGATMVRIGSALFEGILPP